MNGNSMKDKEAQTNDQDLILDVSPEQYEESKARGLDEESLFKPGRHVFRRRDPNKILKKENRTVVLHLDDETFDYYRQLAAEKQAVSVEEQIAAELRSLAEKEAA
jgi:hypothetical protein